jgi:hypothetical protein
MVSGDYPAVYDLAVAIWLGTLFRGGGGGVAAYHVAFCLVAANPRTERVLAIL